MRLTLFQCKMKFFKNSPIYVSKMIKSRRIHTWEKIHITERNLTYDKEGRC